MRRFLLLMAGTLALCSCLDVGQPVDSPTNPATETFDPSLGVDIAQMTKTALGDYYKDITIGSGSQLSAPATVFMTYNGFLKNAAIFDEETDIEVDLTGNVPPGLRDAMLGIRVGGERLIVIPSELGYGPNAVGSIPPNSTLVFDVRLDAIP